MENKKIEIWKDIPGYEGRYQVSDEGRVRSVDREIPVLSRSGALMHRKYRSKILSPGRIPSGHLTVALGHGANGTTVHSLVMLAFVGPCPPGMEVCHIDLNPTNNALTNLRYDTRSANLIDEYQVDRGARAKLTVEQVREIRDCLERGGRGTGAELARRYNVSHSAISAIKKGRSFRWLV